MPLIGEGRHDCDRHLVDMHQWQDMSKGDTGRFGEDRIASARGRGHRRRHPHETPQPTEPRRWGRSLAAPNHGALHGRDLRVPGGQAPPHLLQLRLLLWRGARVAPTPPPPTSACPLPASASLCGHPTLIRSPLPPPPTCIHRCRPLSASKDLRQTPPALADLRPPRPKSIIVPPPWLWPKSGQAWSTPGQIWSSPGQTRSSLISWVFCCTQKLQENVL